jgi:hypothetical protein
VFQTNRNQQDLYLDNMETITNSRGVPEEDPLSIIQLIY